MKLKNAGIQEGDIKAAMKRMIDGETFYYDGYRVYYDADAAMADGMPFMAVRVTGHEIPIKGLWDRVSLWQVEYDAWTPCWCFVSDNDTVERRVVKWIQGYWPTALYPYEGTHCAWKLATPLTPEDLTKGD